jgi:hypothetical protein
VDSDARRAYTDALKLLGRRELSETQIRQRLARRKHDANAINAAIDRLLEERSIDDVRVAEAIARSQTSLRKRGKLRVRLQIERAGIAAATRHWPSACGSATTSPTTGRSTGSIAISSAKASSPIGSWRFSERDASNELHPTRVLNAIK